MLFIDVQSITSLKTMQMIAVQPTDPTQMPDQGDRVKNAPSEVRLLQLDIAVKDKRVEDITGWVWGTFMYVGNGKHSDPCGVSITRF
jgi:hypothetical protein